MGGIGFLSAARRLGTNGLSPNVEERPLKGRDGTLIKEQGFSCRDHYNRE